MRWEEFLLIHDLAMCCASRGMFSKLVGIGEVVQALAGMRARERTHASAVVCSVDSTRFGLCLTEVNASAYDEPRRQRALAQIRRVQALPRGGERRVIAFGLYGRMRMYTLGMIRNAELARLVYPGWTVRVYHDDTVPRVLLRILTRLQVELVDMTDKAQHGIVGASAGMFWRFLVASEAGIDRYIIRDADSRIGLRERFAVEDWVRSGTRLHAMRDHPLHRWVVQGGMWGGTHAGVPDMRELVERWKARSRYSADQSLLNTLVWPRRSIQTSHLIHDAFTCTNYSNATTWRPFPTRRFAGDFVGQKFLSGGQRGDVRSITQAVSPAACLGPTKTQHLPCHLGRGEPAKA